MVRISLHLQSCKPCVCYCKLHRLHYQLRGDRLSHGGLPCSLRVVYSCLLIALSARSNRFSSLPFSHPCRNLPKPHCRTHIFLAPPLLLNTACSSEPGCRPSCARPCPVICHIIATNRCSRSITSSQCSSSSNNNSPLTRTCPGYSLQPHWMHNKDMNGIKRQGSVPAQLLLRFHSTCC